MHTWSFVCSTSSDFSERTLSEHAEIHDAQDIAVLRVPRRSVYPEVMDVPDASVVPPSEAGIGVAHQCMLSPARFL